MALAKMQGQLSYSCTDAYKIRAVVYSFSAFGYSLAGQALIFPSFVLTDNVAVVETMMRQ